MDTKFNVTTSDKVNVHHEGHIIARLDRDLARVSFLPAPGSIVGGDIHIPSGGQSSSQFGDIKLSGSYRDGELCLKVVDPRQLRKERFYHYTYVEVDECEETKT